ncbi:unnamed protein product, partial [Cladocopium goreaui]
GRHTGRTSGWEMCPELVRERCGALEDLESAKVFMKPEEEAQLKAIAETMARATPQLVSSVEAIFEALTCFGNNNFAVTDDLFLAVGAGCFPVGASLNHCCRPNCLLAYELLPGHLPVQAVRVMEPVLAGEELTHSYVDLALPRGQRQDQLKETYGFHCSCLGCRGELPEIERFLEAELKPGDPGSPGSSAELAKAEQLRLQAATEEDPHVELKILEECGLRERWLHPRHLEVCAAHAAAHTAAMAAFDWVAAEKHCGKLVEQYLAVYPPWHPITGLQMFTLAELKEQLGKLAEAQSCYEGAERILRLTHGEGHELVLQLKERLAESHELVLQLKERLAESRDSKPPRELARLPLSASHAKPPARGREGQPLRSTKATNYSGQRDEADVLATGFTVREITPQAAKLWLLLQLVGLLFEFNLWREVQSDMAVTVDDEGPSKQCCRTRAICAKTAFVILVGPGCGHAKR